MNPRCTGDYYSPPSREDAYKKYRENRLSELRELLYKVKGSSHSESLINSLLSDMAEECLCFRFGDE